MGFFCLLQASTFARAFQKSQYLSLSLNLLSDAENRVQDEMGGEGW